MIDDATVPNLRGSSARLSALRAVLFDTRGREAAGDPLDGATLGDVAVQIRVELTGVQSAIDDMGDWGAPTPLLAAAYAVARENLDCAWRSLDEDGADENQHAVLHGLLDAAFHGGRAADGLTRLGEETVDEARQVSREENRQDFMAG
jgi:hypothetical protein